MQQLSRPVSARELQFLLSLGIQFETAQGSHKLRLSGDSRGFQISQIPSPERGWRTRLRSLPRWLVTAAVAFFTPEDFFG